MAMETIGRWSNGIALRPLDHPPEETLWAEKDDQEKDDEDCGILQLRRQHDGRHLLHQTDGHAAPEGADDAAHAAEHDAGIHHDHIVEADKGMKRVVGGEQAAGNCRNAGAERKGDAVRAISKVNNIIVTKETTASMPRALLTKMLMSKNGPSSQAELDNGVRIEASTEPNTISPPFCRISAIPSVRINWA